MKTTEFICTRKILEMLIVEWAARREFFGSHLDSIFIGSNVHARRFYKYDFTLPCAHQFHDLFDLLYRGSFWNVLLYVCVSKTVYGRDL